LELPAPYALITLFALGGNCAAFDEIGLADPCLARAAYELIEYLLAPAAGSSVAIELFLSRWLYVVILFADLIEGKFTRGTANLSSPPRDLSLSTFLLFKTKLYSFFI